MTLSYVALLRGINVGGKNVVPMAELRELFASLGHSSVSTFIQSGNVLFSSNAPVSPETLQAAVTKRFKLDITVVLREPAELRHVVASNPFAAGDPTKVHVGFMTSNPSTNSLHLLEKAAFEPEEFTILGKEVYLYLPAGMARTKLPSYLYRHLQLPITFRNWRTVTKLMELAAELAGLDL